MADREIHSYAKMFGIKMSHTYDYLLIKKQTKIKAIFACYLKVRYASGPSVKYAEKHSNPLKHKYTRETDSTHAYIKPKTKTHTHTVY